METLILAAMGRSRQQLHDCDQQLQGKVQKITKNSVHVPSALKLSNVLRSRNELVKSDVTSNEHQSGTSPQAGSCPSRFSYLITLAL
jgi:hypothetical protein